MEHLNGVKNEAAIRIPAIKYLYVDNEPSLLIPLTDIYAEHAISLYVSSGIKFNIMYSKSEVKQFEKSLQEFKQIVFNN